MIRNANFSPEQIDVIKEVCDIEIDELISMKASTHEIQQFLNNSNVDATIEEIDRVLSEQISSFFELKKNPNSIFMLDSRNREIVELTILWFIDKYDGNPVVNRIYSKIFFNQDLQKQTTVN